MRFYLDSSIALHAVLPAGDRRARHWVDRMTGADQIFASSLVTLEMIRALRRERLDLARARMLDDRVTHVSIDDGILRSAAAIEPHVRSLDAIHLATCSLLGPGVTLVTHDISMTRAAEQIGIATHDPLGE